MTRCPTLKAHLIKILNTEGIEALKRIFNHETVNIPIESIKKMLEAEQF